MDEMRDGSRGQCLIKGGCPKLSTEVMLLSFVGIHDGVTVIVAKQKSWAEFLFISAEEADEERLQLVVK